MGWKLPHDFYPDCHIHFDMATANASGSWPTGTNLLHVGQAKDMLEYCIGDALRTALADRDAECDTIAEMNHAQWLALENVRMLASRNAKEDWAQHMLRFCASAGSVASPLRTTQPKAEPCQHSIADARNPVVKNGYICVKCGALFSAADHAQPKAEPVKLTPDQKDAERKAFEQWYVENAFDYERDPLGSKLCGDQWAAWKYRAAAPQAKAES